MASFLPAYQLVFDAEGGYQRFAEDRGNYNSRGDLVGTNWGISAPVYEEWIGRPPTTADMQSMSHQEAKQILKARFWDVIQGDSIANQSVANILFDGRVNHGRSGVKILQRVLKVKVDGVVGNQTLSAVNRANPNRLFNAYKEARRRYYHAIVNNKPSQGIFLKGWLNRLNQFQWAAAGSWGVLSIGLAVYVWYKVSNNA